MLDLPEINYRDIHTNIGSLQAVRRWKQADRLREEKAAGLACLEQRVSLKIK